MSKARKITKLTCLSLGIVAAVAGVVLIVISEQQPGCSLVMLALGLALVSFAALLK